jgi:hypothetical protein
MFLSKWDLKSKARIVHQKLLNVRKFKFFKTWQSNLFTGTGILANFQKAMKRFSQLIYVTIEN